MRLYYNHEESRLRALIRLLLQFLVFILLSIPLALVPYELSLSAPLWYFPFMGFISAFALFGSVLFACRYLDKRRPASLGLMLSKDWWTDFAFGLLLGIALVSLAFLIELSLGWVRVESFLYSRPDGPGFMLSFGSFLVLFVCVGFY
jgi:hypothetical protein